MNKKLSTFECEMKDEKFKNSFDTSYKEFLLSELLICTSLNSMCQTVCRQCRIK
jgi:hypothetical protein